MNDFYVATESLWTLKLHLCHVFLIMLLQYKLSPMNWRESIKKKKVLVLQLDVENK